MDGGAARSEARRAIVARLGGRLYELRWLIALNAFLLSPLALYELRIGHGGPDRSFLFLLPASLLWLLLVQLPVERPFHAHLAMAPLYLATAVDLYLITHYGMRLGSSTMLVIVENFADAGEFLRTQWRPVAATALACFTFCGVGISRIRDLRGDRRWRATLGTALALAALYFVAERRAGGLFFLLVQDRSAPMGVFPQAHVALSLREDLLRQGARAASFSFGAIRQSPPAEPETYVLVIGESSRPDHWGIYGYSRPTTPRLSVLPNLVVFRDVVAQASITGRAVPLLLTRGSARDPDRTARERSIVSVFQELGFETYWFSTQQRDLSTGMINRFASEADVRRFYERRHDAVTVEALNAALEAISANGPPRRFIVIHTLGSHFYFPSRYPDEFRVYPTEGPGAAGVQGTINAYDNTILYTDHVLSSLVETLQRRQGLKALMFVSDHGENLFDDDRHLMGHMLNTQYDLPIPFLVWLSPELVARHPEKRQHAMNARWRRLSSRNVFYSLVDLIDARLGDGDPQVATLSVFNAGLAEVPRLVLAEPAVFDFDQRFPRGLLAGPRPGPPAP